MNPRSAVQQAARSEILAGAARIMQLIGFPLLLAAVLGLIAWLWNLEGADKDLSDRILTIERDAVASQSVVSTNVRGIESLATRLTALEIASSGERAEMAALRRDVSGIAEAIRRIEDRLGGPK